MPAEISQKSTDSFIDKSLGALPRSVLVVFGILFALTMFLVVTGWNNTVSRIFNAHATRIERAVDSLETTTARIALVEKSTAVIASRVDTIDVRLKNVEQVVDSHLHKAK